jgi:hypothetical protein
MGDKTSDFVFSIDPGIVNIGVCCYNGATREIIFAGKLMIAPSMKDLPSEAELIPRIFKLFFDDKKSPYKKMIDASKVVVIENQMKRKMLLVQHIIGTFCFRSNLDYMFADPRSVKAHFKTGKKTRKDTGKAVKGAKTNYKANKEMALAKAVELFPVYMAGVSATKKDDVADALLQAVWYSEAGGATVERGTKVVAVISTLLDGKKKRKRTTTSGVPSVAKKRKPAVKKKSVVNKHNNI